MFIDRAKIYVKAGKGGNGMSSFRREKFVPKGGPNGGDGGRGGNVVFQVDPNLNTLLDFRYKRKFGAEDGGNGQSSNMHGRNGEMLYINVPPGTIVKDEASGNIIADLTVNGQQFIAAKGGRGGRGNARFVSSTKRAPTFAENGEPGEERSLALELKLLADVGLIGYPSVGKSSIIARVSAAKPEIAAYHFTTTAPVLGVVRLAAEQNFVLADIPGLIEGAHEGAGLGHDFLRHIERTRLLIHVLDVSGFEGREPLDDYKTINNELKSYSERLANRPQIVAANKMDLPAAREKYAAVAAALEKEGREVFPVSAATGEGLSRLMARAFTLLKEIPVPVEPVAAEKTYKAEPEEEFIISRADDGAYIVQGERIEKLVAMTNFDNDEALYRFQSAWRKMGLDVALRARGIKENETVRIRDMEFEFKE